MAFSAQRIVYPFCNLIQHVLHPCQASIPKPDLPKLRCFSGHVRFASASVLHAEVEGRLTQGLLGNLYRFRGSLETGGICTCTETERYRERERERERAEGESAFVCYFRDDAGLLLAMWASLSKFCTSAR